MSNNKHPFGRIQPQPQRPPMVALDRFGKPLEAGHLIMFHCDEDLIFEIVSVGPVLNPAVQGGQAIQVVLAAQFPVMFQPAMPNRTMVIIGETQARITERAGSNGKSETTPSGIVLTDVVPTDESGPGDEGAPRDLGDTGEE